MNEKIEQASAGVASELNAELEALRKKRGVFAISTDLIEANTDAILKIMGKCVIYRAESMFIDGVIEYMAISECFAEIKNYEITPRYTWIINENGDVVAERRSI